MNPNSVRPEQSERCTEHDPFNLLLQAWCEAFSDGDVETFERRLLWDGLNRQSALGTLAAMQISYNTQFSYQTHILRDYTTIVLSAGPEAHDRCTHPNYPIAFEEVLIPFVVIARSRLIRSAGRAYAGLCVQAHCTLERALLERLSWLFKRTLDLELAIFQATRCSPDETGDSYWQFVDFQRSEGLPELFGLYPVLSRLTASTIDNWVEAQSEMIRRLSLDRENLDGMFGRGTALGKVIAVNPVLSDPHDGGRSVCALSFASQKRILYKPKDIRMEVCWNDLLSWINTEGVEAEMKTFMVLARDGYGWSEYVEALPCRTEDETKRFSRRAGMLVFLGYLLDATDLHHENVVRCGEHPVLIDLETLLHPWVAVVQSYSQGEKCVGHAEMRDSVLRSGLLPVRGKNEKELSDQSGFGAGSSCSMGQPSDKLDVGEILAGFEELYRLFIRHRDRLLSSESPLWAFSSCPVRFVFRATGDYMRLIHGSMKPTLLRDGVLRGLYFEALNRVARPYPERPSFWPILKAERQALESMDVPLFVVQSDSRDVVLDSGEAIPNYFVEPSMDRVMNRLRGLTEVDLKHQMDSIRSALVPCKPTTMPGSKPTGA